MSLKIKELFPKEDSPLSNNITIYLLISMGKKECTGAELRKIIDFVKSKIKTGFFLYEKKYQIEKIRFDIGDTLHRFNLKGSEEVKLKKSLQMGLDWINENIENINLLLPEENKINKKTKINNDKNVLYKGDKSNPAVEIIRNEYWRQKKDFFSRKKATDIICSLPNSIIQRSIEFEATLFYKSMKKYNSTQIIDKENFIKSGINYLKEEVVLSSLLLTETPNGVELYPGEINYFPSTFRGKKVRKDEEIQKIIKTQLPFVDKRRSVRIYV